MIEKNYDYLKDQLKYTGFGESEGLHKDMREKMQSGVSDFVLFHQASFGKDETVCSLQFKKGTESDNYFFNRYNFMLRNEKNEVPGKQTFYLGNKEDNITLKEAYNLMKGRAVHKEMTPKEGEKFMAWIQLDFKNLDSSSNYKMKQFHENYGYNLEAALAKHPIKELNSETEKVALIKSLERGNRQMVTLVEGSKENKAYIEASPQYKSVNLYHTTGERIRTTNRQEEEPAKRQDVNLEVSEGAMRKEQISIGKVEETKKGIKQDVVAEGGTKYKADQKNGKETMSQDHSAKQGVKKNRSKKPAL
jgi:hypothetical protein